VRVRLDPRAELRRMAVGLEEGDASVFRRIGAHRGCVAEVHREGLAQRLEAPQILDGEQEGAAVPDADLEVGADAEAREQHEVAGELPRILPAAQPRAAEAVQLGRNLLKALIVQPERREQRVLQPGRIPQLRERRGAHQREPREIERLGGPAAQVQPRPQDPAHPAAHPGRQEADRGGLEENGGRHRGEPAGRNTPERARTRRRGGFPPKIRAIFQGAFPFLQGERARPYLLRSAC